MINREGEPIRAEDLEKQQQKASQDVQALRAITSKFAPSEAFVTLGIEMVFSGERHKYIEAYLSQGLTGTEAFHLGLEDLTQDEHGAMRQDLSDDLDFALTSQAIHFRMDQTPRGELAHEIGSFCQTVTNRVVASKVDIAEPFPWEFDEALYQAEYVEVMRRSILQSPYSLIMGVGESISSIRSFDEDEFWEKASNTNEKIAQELGGYGSPGFHKRQKQASADIVETRTDEEWDELLMHENDYTLEYVYSAAQRKLREVVGQVEFRKRLQKNDEYVYTDEEIAHLLSEAARIRLFVDEIGKIDNFSNVLPLTNQLFGGQATYDTLLDLMTPSSYIL